MIHKFSRYLLTLVALLAMTTGAWADEGELLVTITPDASGNIVYSVADIATLDLGGAEYNSSKGCWRKFGGAAYLTVTAADGINVTKVKFTTNKNDSWEDTDAPYQVQLDGGYALNASGSSIGTGDGIKKIEVYGTKAVGPVVEISDDQQSAEFDMPSYDATLEYDIVRNMKSNVDVQVLFNMEETTRLRIAKDSNGKYQLVNGWKFIAYDNIDANNPVSLDGQVIYTFKKKNAEGGYDAVDTYNNGYSTGTWRLEAEGIENGNYVGTAYGKDITLYEGYDLTLTSAQASSVAVTIGDAAVTPEQGGRIQGVEIGKSVKLSVSEGYMFSDMFTGYKVSFTPAGDALAWNEVGCYYWGYYGGNDFFNPVQWPGVEMTKNGNNWETTVNVIGLTNIIFNDFKENNAQQTSDLPFASGAADDLGSYTIADAVEMTYNNAKTEATFSMPASNVGMNFNVKRNLSVKTAAEMAERIRINKTGDTYSPIQMTDVQPTVTNNLDAQNPVVLEFGKDYSTTLQKKGEGQDEWIDTQDYGVGTYRLMVTGNGEYGGTCYTNEFELYAGYEVTVAAGEYISYYSNEALTIEDENAQMYTISSVTETEAQLSDAIKVAPKETPLLVYNKSTEEKTFLLIPTEADADEVSVAKEFKGTLTAGEIPASTATVDYYALNGKAFVWVKYAIEIGANKCWLQIGEQPATTRANTRSIVGGGDTTRIKGTDYTDYTDSDYYDLQGRKVATPNRKGIYIKNGQKVIIK